MAEAFNFAKPVDVSWASVYSNEIYLRQVYMAIKNGYQPKADVVPFLVEDVRDITRMHTFFYDDDFSRKAFLDTVVDRIGSSVELSDSMKSSVRDTCMNGILYDAYDFHEDALFGDKNISVDQRRVVAKDFGHYIYDVRTDMSDPDRKAVQYASALLYMAHPDDANPFKSVGKSYSFTGKTAESLLDASIKEFNDFRNKRPEEAYSFMRYLSHDELSVDMPAAFVALRDEMSAKSDAYKAVMSAKAEQEKVNPRRIPFDGQAGHALENWSPNKDDNGFDYDEADDEEELQ